MQINMNFFIRENFELFKAVLFALLFSSLFILQYFFAHQHSLQQRWQNFKVNLTLAIINSIIFGSLCGACVAMLTNKMQGHALFAFFSITYELKIFLTILILDFTAYFFHRLYHRISICWRLHSMHHSDIVFETSTALRFHPGELFLSLIVRIALVWCFGFPVLGLFTFEALFLFFNLLEHSDLSFPNKVDRLLSFIFITPAMHRIHHSIQINEQNSNFGTIFSFWDRALGTMLYKNADQKIVVGLQGIQRLGFIQSLTLPFRRDFF